MDAGTRRRFATGLSAMVAVVLEGAIEVSVSSAEPTEVATVSAGHAFINLGHVTHSVESTASTTMVLVDLPIAGRPAPQLKVVNSLPLKLERYFNNFDEALANVCVDREHESLRQLADAVADSDLISSARALRKPRSHAGARMEMVKALLDGRFRQHIRLADIAHHFSMDPAYLSRNFRKAFSVAPKQYLYSLRRESFLRSLVLGDGALASRALDAGFTDYVNLCHRFQREFGTSPSNLRVRPSRVV